MRYLLFAFIIFVATFFLAFLASLIKRRLAFISLALSYLGANVCLMDKYGIPEFLDLIKGIDNFIVYLFIASIGCFLIMILEVALMKKRKNKKISKIKEEKIYLERDTKIYYFNLLNEDVAYYNDKKQKYILNNSFRRRLNTQDIEIKEEDLINLIPYEDKEVFKEGKDNTQFKIITEDGYEWYQIRENIIGEDIFKLIYKIENKLGKDAVVYSYKDLDKTLKEYEKEGKSFAILLSNIQSIKEYLKKTLTNLSQFKDVKEKELREVILVKYFTSILNGDLKDLVKIYKIGGNEYAFLIQNREAYFAVERALFNNQSIFLKSDIDINDKKYAVNAKCAAVYSEYVRIKDDYHVINAAFDLLQMLVAGQNGQSFAVYQSLKEDEKKLNLKDLGIDLDNDIKKFYKSNNE